MNVNKPRHNPDKPQNKKGGHCSGWDVSKCKGNPHNCTKVKYQILASRSDKQKNDDVGITNKHY